VRVLIVDDHPLYVEAVRTLLVRAFRGASIEYFQRLDEGLDYLSRTPVDLVMLDFSMPGIDGHEGVTRMVAAAGAASVVVMSGVAGAREVQACIAAGAKGFLPKTMEGRVFTDAVALILHGGSYIPAEFVGKMAETPAHAEEGPEEGTALQFNQREAQLLRLVVAGASNKEIARKTDLQEVTVKFYLTRLFRRLGVKNRAQAAVVAVRYGFGSSD
jgi:DNA-binding NarL/FixJ family response regulator